MQALGKTRALRALAFARGRTFGASKDRQKIRAGIKAVVGKLQGAHSNRQAVELRLCLDRLIYRIEQHLGCKPPWIESRKVVPIGAIVIVWDRTQLVRRRR